MSRLVLNHVLNDKKNMPKLYWIPRMEDHGRTYISLGKLVVPKGYAGKRLRLRLDVEVI